MNEALDKAESALVGAAIRDPRVFHEAALLYSQFFNARMQLAWKCIGKLINSNQTVDEISVSDQSKKKLSPPELSECVLSVGVVNTLYWANMVRDQYVQRGVAELNSEFTRWTKSGLTGPQMLDKIHKQIERLENANEQSLPTLAKTALSECERIRNTPLDDLRGLPAGLGIKRVVPGGISRGKVTTIFSESGNYKTTTKNNIVLSIATAGYRILDCSFEDADDLTAHRFIASCTGLNYGRIAAYELSEKERAKLHIPEKAVKAATNVILAGEIIPNIDEIIRTARLYKHKGGLDAVVIDYIQLLESNNHRHSAKEVLDEICRKAQLAAKRDNMAYILISQVKQDVDQRTDHRPRITDMLGSSAMRTASKLSIGLFRPALYYKVPQKGSPYEKMFANDPNGAYLYDGMLELHFLKNVLGEPQVVTHCLVHAATGHMEPYDMRAWL